MMIKHDPAKIYKWYHRKDIIKLIMSYNKYKYITYMAYKPDGKACPPRRFITLINDNKFLYLLEAVSVYRQPVSIYRDVDNWKITRPFFSWTKEKYVEERKMFFDNGEYKKHIHSSDFIVDIDSENVYSSWETTKKVIDLFRKFDVMCCVYCSGKKGFQILIPSHKAIPKEYHVENEISYNTHEVFAYNLKQFIDDVDDCIDMSVYSELRFVKQQFSLDGRNMCPIIPLKYEEFIEFYNYKDVELNPYMDIDYWNTTCSNFLERGFCWHGKSNMTLLEKHIDEWIEKKVNT